MTAGCERHLPIAAQFVDRHPNQRLAGLSDSERNAVLGGNAIETYNLKGLEL